MRGSHKSIERRGIKLDRKLNEIQGLEEATKFIRTLMDEEPAHIEIQESHDEEEETLRVEKTLSEKGFHLLPERAPAKRVAAIDGGSLTVANGRSFVIGALRVGGCIFEGDAVVEEILSPPKMINISRVNAQVLYTKAYEKATGKTPKAFPSHDDMLGRLRTMEEWMLAREVLRKLSRKDVLLIDGSLKASMSVPHVLIRSICEKAAERGVHLIGVSKASSLYLGSHAPLVSMVFKKGEERHSQRAWLYEVSQSEPDSRWMGNIYVAKLNPAAEFAFRVDINKFDGENPTSVVASIIPFCRDPVYLGYPYPLAEAHNIASFASGESEDVYYALQSRAIEEGISLRDWRIFFEDFHALLDINR